MTPVRYAMVEEVDPQRLAARVVALQREGWEINGPAIITKVPADLATGHAFRFCQPMVKRSDPGSRPSHVEP